MKNATIRSLLATMLFASGFCLRDALGAESMINSREVRIARIVERYVATHYQSFESLKYDMLVKKEVDKLVVFFKLPDGVIGGTPTVVLKEDSLEVVQAYRTQ